jgi:hypothetical protein
MVSREVKRGRTLEHWFHAQRESITIAHQIEDEAVSLASLWGESSSSANL